MRGYIRTSVQTPGCSSELSIFSYMVVWADSLTERSGTFCESAAGDFTPIQSHVSFVCQKNRKNLYFILVSILWGVILMLTIKNYDFLPLMEREFPFFCIFYNFFPSDFSQIISLVSRGLVLSFDTKTRKIRYMA